MASIYGAANPQVQRALIQLCFGDDSEAAVHTVDAAIKSDTLFPSQFRALPHLYTKDSLSRFSEFSQSKIRGSYKQTFYRNSLLLDRAARMERILQDCGFGSVLFLKGVPMLLRNPTALGRRPMADLDVLVPQMSSRVSDAVAVFAKHQLTVVDSSVRSVTVLDEKGFEYDFHWYLSDWALRRSTVETLFARRDELSYGAHTFGVPCIEHHLAHVLIHGMLSPDLRYNGRWAIDALTILSENREFDVEEFLAFTREFILPGCVKDALSLLRDETPMDVPVPRELLSTLIGQLPSSRSILSWVYTRTPVEEVPQNSAACPHNRSDWFKYNVCAFIVAPWVLFFHNGISPIESLSRTLGFSSTSLPKTLCSLIKRALIRIPYLIFNIWVCDSTARKSDGIKA